MSKPEIKIIRKIESDSEWQFEVEVGEENSATIHNVIVSTMTYQKLTGGKYEPDDLVIRSFEFLLRKERQESILRQFNLDQISDYFPKWEKEMIKTFLD